MKFAPFIIFHDCNDGLMLSKIDSALKVLKKKIMPTNDSWKCHTRTKNETINRFLHVMFFRVSTIWYKWCFCTSHTPGNKMFKKEAFILSQSHWNVVTSGKREQSCSIRHVQIYTTTVPMQMYALSGKVDLRHELDFTTRTTLSWNVQGHRKSYNIF